MKLDRDGIQFNLWLFFCIFAIGIMISLGVLQFSLIKPYYRDNKIQTVKRVSDQIQTYVIEQNTQTQLSRAFQVAVDNNVCIAIYNEQGMKIYDADSLGSGCVFRSASIMKENIGVRNGNELKQLLIDNEGEYSINLVSQTTGQDMIVYGRTIHMNLENFYIFVNSPLEPVDSIVQFFSRQYIIYTVFIVFVASVVSMFIARRITKPIVKMKKQADELASANYEVVFEGGRFSETKELAYTLNDATKKLSKIDELRKDLVANVSHDIKTPLTSIRAYAEMIRDLSGDIPNKRNEHLNVIIQEADYLDHLATDMSELSKMQSGSYVLKQTNFDIGEVMREAVTLNEVMIQDGQLNVHVEVDESLTVFGDVVKISQVINNFLSNAIKHTPAGKNIYLRAFREEDEETVRIEVQDEGEGISEDELPYIWDRYQKSSRSFSRSMTNTGLGLSIVKAILEVHHAKYGVISTVDEGSLFYFELKRPEEIEELENEE